MDASDANIPGYLSAAHGFADEARTIAQRFTSSDFSVSTKTDKSLVTEADIEIERTLRQRISLVICSSVYEIRENFFKCQRAVPMAK